MVENFLDRPWIEACFFNVYYSSSPNFLIITSFFHITTFIFFSAHRKFNIESKKEREEKGTFFISELTSNYPYLL